MLRIALIVLFLLCGCTPKEQFTKEEILFAFKQRDVALEVLASKIIELDAKVNPKKEEVKK